MRARIQYKSFIICIHEQYLLIDPLVTSICSTEQTGVLRNALHQLTPHPAHSLAAPVAQYSSVLMFYAGLKSLES